MLELVKLVGWNESPLYEKRSNSDLSFSRVERNEMGHRCCTKQKVKRGLWSPEEDEKLITHITTYGHGSWSSVPKLAGLQRCGKSCRLRWINYLRPDLKKGSFTQEEEQIIIDVHRILGNRWAQIAKHLPGRTDNEVKNFWNSCIKKKLISQGLDPQTHNLISSSKNQKSSVSNNKISNTTSFVVSHETVQKQPIISAFSMKSTNNIRSDKDHNLLNPHLLTTPPYNNVQTTPNISSSSSSSVDIQHLSKSCFLDDQFGIWDSSFPPFEAPKTVSEREYRKSLQGQHYNNIQQQQLLENHQKIWEMQNDFNSFENDDCFENGFITESASPMYEALMSQDFSSVQYDLAWNY